MAFVKYILWYTKVEGLYIGLFVCFSLSCVAFIATPFYLGFCGSLRRVFLSYRQIHGKSLFVRCGASCGLLCALFFSVVCCIIKIHSLQYIFIFALFGSLMPGGAFSFSKSVFCRAMCKSIYIT